MDYHIVQRSIASGRDSQHVRAGISSRQVKTRKATK